MSRTTAWLSAYLLLSCYLLPLAAQQTSATASDAVVPPLVNFSGVLTDVNNKPLSGTVGVTFALYVDAQGGAPLWLETQNVQPDKTGHYSVLLGSTLGQGLPSNLFASGTARWLGVQPQGQTEQPRVLLVAVPYALKALDAETIGGKPASAFALATPASTSPATNPVQPTVTQSASAAAGSPSITGSGKPGYISEWLSTTKLGDSGLFQSSAGNLGISTVTPAQKFEIDLGNMLVRGADNFSKSGDTAYVYVGDAHHTVEAMYATGLALGAYKVPQAIFIQDKTGNVGIGTTTPAAGILTTVANSAKVVGVSATGWNAPNGSNANGFDAIHTTGGNADQNASTDLNGGAGLVSTGGLGFSADGEGNWGPGVVANGGSANGGGNSGDGIDANGGNGDFLFSGGGTGITATGGTGVYGASGGIFTGGDGRYGGGDGIDVTVGGGASPLTVATFCCTASDGVDSAGSFSGDIYVSGAIYAGTKDFRIDHPLDPANKYLIHASVESSEMMNIYTGNATLNDKGEATVQLPGWFEAVNGDFRYQLTAIGRPSPGLYVAQEISGNQFQIAGGTAGTKVSWQVTGVRHDAYAKANPLQVERGKTFERGYYIHPELYGAPEERGIEWLRHPAFMKRAKQVRMKQRSTSWSTRGIAAIPSPRPVAAGSILDARQ